MEEEDYSALNEVVDELSDKIINTSLDDDGDVDEDKLLFLATNTAVKALAKYACRGEDKVDSTIREYFTRGLKDVSIRIIRMLSHVDYQEYLLEKLIEKMPKETNKCCHCGK